MTRKLTYAKAGVDRELRAKSKAALKTLAQTYNFSTYGEILHLPYGNIFPVGDRYFDLSIEGVGTKVLLAQLANKFDTIGVDAVAMAVNDLIRSGAKPLALVDNIHAQVSDPILVEDWMKGIVQGAVESQCIVVGGEIGDVSELIKGLEEGKGFDMIVAGIGEVEKDDIIFGRSIKPKDVVIGMQSSGIHSNGITLARRVLFKRWGGKFDPYDVPEGLDRELIYETLKPTKIYAKPVQQVAKQHKVKGAVHVTGDAYLKFNKLAEFSRGIGFEFNNFRPQPIFGLLQETGGITDEEMLKTFNMGYGFAVVVAKEEQDSVLDILEKERAEAAVIGQVTSARGITAFYKKRKLVLK